uniref:Uncharacterized protein n=1 Tax=Sphaerodactylus townsendi TaxID=933632 RepID=A0ACB8FYX1_9SAUR
MGTNKYSGYLADDESFKGPQMRNPNASHGRGSNYWRNLMRPPSRCGFRNQDTTHSSFSASSAFAHAHQGKRKRHRSTCEKRNLTEDEFSDFMNFLADEDVLDSLQKIVEDAVRKLRDVTTENGEHLFEIVDDICSSSESESWSVSYSHRHTDSSSTYSEYKYYTATTTATTTATSNSDEDRERPFQSMEKKKPVGKVCLLDKFVSRLSKPKKEKKVTGGFHAEQVSEQSGDTYYFLQEHFHIWAKLAESFHQLPKKDYFTKFKKLPKQELSAESLHKEITNVLKYSHGLPLYSAEQEPFLTLDFLEENGLLAALQDIINEAVQKVLDATLVDGAPLFDLFGDHGLLSVPWESSVEDSDEEEERGREAEGEGEGEGEKEDEGKDEGSESGEGSGSGTESEEGSKSDAASTPGKKKKKRKGKRDKKQAPDAAEEKKGKQKYTPPALAKSRRKSGQQDESQRKAKYVPPPLPKTKPRPPPEEPPPKAKYTPPPLPKPKKKQEVVAQAEAQTEQAKKFQKVPRHIITTKDIKRAHLQARPLPKQAIIDFLIENAAKLMIYKYNYETLLSEKLGFISVPVTKILLEMMFGYKKIKGSRIQLTSQIDWTKVNEEIYAPRQPKPKTPKLKSGDKKKKKKSDDKKKADDKKRPGSMRKSVAFKPEMPTGKVVVTSTPTEKMEVKVVKTKGKPSTPERAGGKKIQITEILPPRLPEEFTAKEISEDVQHLETEESSTRSGISQGSFIKFPSVTLEPEGPPLSRRLSDETIDSKRGSASSILPQAALAAGCVEMAFATMDWNSPAKGFYLKLGAQDLTQLEEWNCMELDREALQRLAQKGNHSSAGALDPSSGQAQKPEP